MSLKDVTASIRQRLLNHAKAHGDDYQRILTRYAIERLLYRLSRTAAASERYMLKGAMLFVTWPQHTFRPTGDLDLLGHGDFDPKAVGQLFAEICAAEYLADGIVLDPKPISAEPVREDDNYQGVRLMLRARLGTAVIPVQVDIGFGDSVFPQPKRRIFPCLLEEMPAANILMYPAETVIAEKFEAMARFGEATSRMKDFHDIWITIRTFDFDLATLVQAVGGTLRRRGTAAPTDMPFVLTPAFGEIDAKQSMWTGFLRRSPPAFPPPPLVIVLEDLRRVFAPVIAALMLPEGAKANWSHDRAMWG
jgi:hypothetical protein